MFKFNDIHKSILECYSRPIVHMRKQVEAKRFGLIFGSGVSQGCKIPKWEVLVDALSKDPEVDGEKVLSAIPPRAALPYKTEMLFQHFRQRRYSKTEPEKHHTRLLDFQIAAEWMELVRKILYANCTGKLVDSLDSHPYLKQYLPLISSSQMTVTYNFDDFLEQSLFRERKDKDMDTLGYESVTNPWVQFRRKNAVIYHPNGAVPQNPLQTPSDRFVFSEASYVKQILGIFAGDQAGVVSHLSKHTCLLIGLSLEDDTLRNVLVQTAHSCPGNFHYYVYYLKPGETLDCDTKRAIMQANFKVYNLITLFLNDEGIRTLGELINMAHCPTNVFYDFAHQNGIPVRFRFYVVGALGVGKSTTINQFRNLFVLDEWLEERPQLLAKGWDKLTEPEKEEANSWIIDQFKRKNDSLRYQLEGVFVIDRGPLDPLTFTAEAEWREKADGLLNTICPALAQWRVEDGWVIFLKGESRELALRMLLTKRKDYTVEALQQMEEWLAKVYGVAGVTTVDTRGLTPSDVVFRVAEIIHLEPYIHTCNLHDRLELIRKEGFNVNE